MADDPDSTALETQQGKPRSRRYLVWIVIAVAIVGSMMFMCVGPNSMLAKFLFPGFWSDNIIDYPEISTDIRTWYPSQARFLPLDIPNNATNIDFSGTNMAALQASPFLSLGFDLNEQDAQAEIARLQALNPTDIITTGYMFSLSEDYEFADDILVFGFLTESQSDFVALVTYDSITGHFYYEFNSD